MKDFFLVPEWWTLADLESMDKSRHGTPVSLIHSTLRMVFGDHGVDWQSFLRGGLLGKAMTAAEQARLAKGEKPVAPPEPLISLDVNVPGQTSNPRPCKLVPRRKKNKDKEPRDCMFLLNDQKWRRGLVLNPTNITGEGDAACFKLPYSSPDDSAASPALKRLCAHLKLTDLSKFAFNIFEKTMEPESGASGTSQTSSPVSSGPLSSALQQKPFVGQFNSSSLLEIYIHPMVSGTILTTEVERHGPGPDCPKSLVITGSFDGTICDEVVTTGKGDVQEDTHLVRQYSELTMSSFPSSEWKVSVPLPSDVDTRKECRGFKRLASGTHVFTIKKKKLEPVATVATREAW